MNKAGRILKISLRRKQHLMLAFGLITGFFVLFTSGLQYQISNKIENDLLSKIEKADEQNQDQTSITAIDALSQTVSVHLITPFLLSFGDLPEKEQVESTELPLISTGINRYFKTLFQLIIAPNAP